ncbi:efflux transporter outer membrane subunit [Sphingomonas xinjiangensis]|uniref:Multidrug efflux system outer membrane protein n=1 Tax=Sphingomonas xinjiangensis TaxID=643568 RepID=A0A840YC83_9SPHN|nr:efflux transporter outer membrane subunit [Sphingomonas xinjiangensis]MBB5709905.1 multidrug efflux system outer membrane protein [Sphingomonas xinjiangensis]
MTKPFLALLAGATILSGCNFAPKYVRPEGAVPTTLPEGGIYPRAATDAPDVSAIGWRDFFLDPRLRQVIETSLTNNRDLRIAAGNVLQARAQLRTQRSELFPTASVNGSATYTNNFGAAGAGAGAGAGTGGGVTPGVGVGTGGSSNLEIYSLNAGISAYEVDLFGRVRNLTRAAQEQVFASEEAQRSARVSLIAETANAWLQMASDQEQLRLSRETLKAFQETLRLTSAQFRIGVGSELEVRQAETNFQAARNDIAALEVRIAQDQNALNLLAGTTVPSSLLPTGFGAEPVTRDVLPGNLSSQVLLRRPDVLRAEHQLIAESANIGAARAAFFPTISLTGLVGTISTALSGLFGGGSFTYQAAPSIGLPIFDGGRRSGNLQYARASQQVAVSTYERTIQVAFREVADALAQRGRIGEQVSAQSQRANAAQVAARLSDARFRAGVDSFLNTLDAQRTAYAAQQQLVTTRLTQASNLVELYRSLGGGLN